MEWVRKIFKIIKNMDGEGNISLVFKLFKSCSANLAKAKIF